MGLHFSAFGRGFFPSRHLVEGANGMGMGRGHDTRFLYWGCSGSGVKRSLGQIVSV